MVKVERILVTMEENNNLEQSKWQDIPASSDADGKLDGQGNVREAVGNPEVVKHVAVWRNLLESL